ncbi:MAG: hypothetical protein AABY64_05945 [Bdellovibrionota bacterium]
MKLLLKILFLMMGFKSANAGISDTLPEGINSPIFKFGLVQGLNQKYNKAGELWRLSDLYSIEFDAPTLAKVNPQAQVLISALNKFGNQRLGDALNLGVLEFNIDPTVSYFAPVYARGISNKWTMALALPIITYKNTVKISRSFSNVDFYKQEFGGKFPELDQALNTDLGAETLKAISAAGYKPLVDKNETFLHDVQLVSFYNLFSQDRISVIHSAYLGLPTGPKFDPDDITALNISGMTSLENGVTFAYNMDYGVTFMSTLSYLYSLPDQITKRVPRNEDDILPNDSTKESIRRTTGSKTTLKNELAVKFNDKYKVGVGHGYAQKNSDSYSGSNGSRYDLLTANTNTQEQTASLSLSYDTVKSYFKKQAVIPAIISYDLSSAFAGQNIERKIIQEISFILFF